MQCRILYKLDGPECEEFQVGLSAEDMRVLDALSLEQLLAQLKRAQLQNRQGKNKYKGVQQVQSGRWQANWRGGRGASGTAFRCATFDDEDEAARAYDRFAMEEAGRYP